MHLFPDPYRYRGLEFMPPSIPSRIWLCTGEFRRWARLPNIAEYSSRYCFPLSYFRFRFVYLSKNRWNRDFRSYSYQRLYKWLSSISCRYLCSPRQLPVLVDSREPQWRTIARLWWLPSPSILWPSAANLISQSYVTVEKTDPTPSHFRFFHDHVQIGERL